jgi:hyperosmotically inducible protein
MKTLATLSAFTIAMALGAGCCISSAQAQTTSAADHSATTQQAVGDAWITTKVKAELATTKGVKSTDISVDTVDGVVTLTGVLSTDVEVKKAVAAAESIKGVKRVDASGLKTRD